MVRWMADAAAARLSCAHMGSPPYHRTYGWQSPHCSAEQRWQHIPCLEQQEQPSGQPWWVTTLDPTRRWVDVKGGLSKFDRSADVAFSFVLCLLTEYLVTDRHSTGHSIRKSWVHMLV